MQWLRGAVIGTAITSGFHSQADRQTTKDVILENTVKCFFINVFSFQLRLIIITFKVIRRFGENISHKFRQEKRTAFSAALFSKTSEFYFSQTYQIFKS